MDRKYLDDYLSLSKEIVDIRHRITEIKSQLARMSGETVKDKVYGGEGGLQGFVIEGFPIKSYSRKKTILQNKMMKLERLESEIGQMIIDVDNFIYTIPDSNVRQIARFRFVDGFSWKEVAQRMGGGNTEDGVRMMFNRYMDKIK